MESTSTNPQETQQETDPEFEAWADERARQFEEFEADRFACGGWRCAGANVPSL